MQAVHHLHGAASGGNPNFQTGGIGGTILTFFAWILGWIEHSSFLQEVLQTVLVAGVGSAVSYSVSYFLNRKFGKK